MSVSTDLLDLMKSRNGGVSDYRAAKMLGVTQPTMSGYRNNRCPLSPEKCILACQLAGLDPIEWLLKLYHERARSDTERNVIERVQMRLAA